jgi:hypothetical protein
VGSNPTMGSLDYSTPCNSFPFMESFTEGDAKILLQRVDAVEEECKEWQYVASKLYRALVVEKNHRGIRWQDAEMVAEALQSYEKIA